MAQGDSQTSLVLEESAGHLVMIKSGPKEQDLTVSAAATAPAISSAHTNGTATSSAQSSKRASEEAPDQTRLLGLAPLVSSFTDEFKVLKLVYEDVNLTLTVPDGSQPSGGLCAARPMIKKQILKNLAGAFIPGQLTAIMGASGSGKTSLLNMMVGKVPKVASEVKGKLLVNGQAVSFKKKKVLMRLFGYVQQHDVILPTVTVREALRMTAFLKLPGRLSAQEKLDRVERTIDLLHLNKCADTQVGDSLQKGISGGELKRLAVALSMLTQPSALFLDEPTSGLDALAALQIVRQLQDLARSGRTVVATIHQPSSDIFHLFDRIILLAQGEIVYDGPREELVNYLGQFGHHCPQYSNPADYVFVHVLNDWHGNPEGAKRTADLVAAWPKSKQHQELLKHTQSLESDDNVDLTSGRSKAPFITQLSWLASRAWKNQFRNKLMLQAHVGQLLFLNLIVGCLYYQTPNTQQGIQNRNGALFFVSINGMMSSMMGVLSIFVIEKPVMVREYEGQLYGLPAYFISKIGVELPFKLIFPFLGVSILYFMIGFRPGFVHFITLGLVVMCMELTGTAMGVAMTSFFSDIAVALQVMPVLFLPLMFFSGFYANSDLIPVWLDWIKYCSPIFYAFVAASKNEYTDLVLTCNPNQLVGPDKICPIISGNQVIALLGFDSQPSIVECLVVLVGYYCICLVLAYYGLRRQLKYVE
eukprot:gb/GEZN01001444.1/.p1 GENE.gb/GEZN01001444.1/~~gb/GEZN01001444.1/.p1  ORF type:complete len:724 (-),score=147.90 gb/GEZN01001444.1/:876-2978(-)